MADIRADLEKLKKEQLIDYAVDVATKYSDLATAYNLVVERNNQLQTQLNTVSTESSATSESSEVLKELNNKIDEMTYINESTKNELETSKKEIEDLKAKLAFATTAGEIAAPMDVGQVMEHPEYIAIFKKAEGLETKVESLTNEYTQLEITLKETHDELNEALATIENLKIEKSSKKLEDINALPKSSNNTISVQTYNINGYENRVDNSKNYGGRQFCIASVMVKYENSILSWQIDFKGSELYPSRIFNRYKVFGDNEKGSLAKEVNRIGWHATLKNYLSIPDDFDVTTFYNTGLFFGTEGTIK